MQLAVAGVRTCTLASLPWHSRLFATFSRYGNNPKKVARDHSLVSVCDAIQVWVSPELRGMRAAHRSSRANQHLRR